MAAKDDDHVKDVRLDADVEDTEAEEDEFADEDGDDVTTDLTEFEAEVDDGDEDIDAVVELTSKEQSARSLEIRRAIERRMEEKRLQEDLDYLDTDLDD